MTTKKKLFIKTYGCQMNVYDSERMADALGPEGFVETKNQDEADIILLNTCHIREKAAEKTYSELGRLRKLKDQRAKQGKQTLIGVAGCVAQAEGEEIIRRAPVVDLVLGPLNYHKLPELIKNAKTKKNQVETEFPTEDKFAHLPAPKKSATIARGMTAFLTVQEGCDKFCSFCVVPYTRGAEVSRPVAQVTQEAERLAQAGVREITLLGQNVNAYHGLDSAGKAVGLGQLLQNLGTIDGLDRLRYTTSHPNDMDDDLIATHANLQNLMPYLHLPVQSGSNAILKAMNRRHTREEYFAVIARMRAAKPDIAISGDFIVGFPGETEEDFDQTLDLVRQIKYAQAYSFKYSTRPGTPGAEMDNQVPEDIKSERLTRLQALLSQHQREFNSAMLGRTLSVLLERKGRMAGQLAGRSPYLQAVHVAADEALLGTIAQVKIVNVGNMSLHGELVESSSTKPAPVSDLAYGTGASI